MKEAVANNPIGSYDVRILDDKTRGDVQVMSDVCFDILQDDASATVSYYGFAAPGTATTAATWRIMRKSVSGNVTSYRYADGTDTFIKVWDNRASYTYL